MSKQIYKDKFYTHFDKKKYHTNYEQSVQNINWVSRHGFYPFIHFQMDCSKYTNDLEGNKFIKEKNRDIYYAAHIDRFIYEYYGNRLNSKYNNYIELIGLNDLRVEGKNVPEVKEDGNTPLENARLKAMVYYEAFQIPVFSCDSGLYFDNVPDEVQPGVHVRNVNGKCLSDDEMIDYYSGLVKAYGNLVARYRNAICFVMDNTHIYEAMEPSMESEKFILTDKPHSTVRKEGFPLDSISLDIKTNKYYYDLPEDKLEQVAVEDGFLEFFKNILNLN